MIALPTPCLCLVTDRRAVDPGAATAAAEIAALERQLDEAIDAGIDLIQIRERDLDGRALAALVRRVVARARATPTRIVVNDRADVAIATGTHGVHLRSDGPPTGRVRELVGPGRLLGRSVHSAAEAAGAREADYLLFGTVFASAQKPAGWPVAGPAALTEVARASAAPVLAIGGVTPARARDCREAGAAGLAAIGAFLPPGPRPGAVGPAAAIAAFRRAWSEGSGAAG